MDRGAVIRTFMAKVHAAVKRSAPKTADARGQYSVTFGVPGLGTDRVIAGVPVSSLITPAIHTPVADRPALIADMLPHLGSASLSTAERALIRGSVGRKVLDFALISPTPEGRLARLLWVFTQDMDREVSANTLMGRKDDVAFGVKDGVIIGGPFSGVPVNIPVEEFLVKERFIPTRSARLTEIRRVLRNKADAEAYEMFGVLYAISEWDKTLQLTSLLVPAPPNAVKRLEAIAKRVETVKEPHSYMCRMMVPYFMTYTDFIKTFGNHDHRRQLRKVGRDSLINKIYALHYFH